MYHIGPCSSRSNLQIPVDPPPLLSVPSPHRPSFSVLSDNLPSFLVPVIIHLGAAALPLSPAQSAAPVHYGGPLSAPTLLDRRRPRDPKPPEASRRNQVVCRSVCATFSRRKKSHAHPPRHPRPRPVPASRTPARPAFSKKNALPLTHRRTAKGRLDRLPYKKTHPQSVNRSQRAEEVRRGKKKNILHVQNSSGAAHNSIPEILRFYFTYSTYNRNFRAPHTAPPELFSHSITSVQLYAYVWKRGTQLHECCSAAVVISPTASSRTTHFRLALPQYCAAAMLVPRYCAAAMLVLRQRQAKIPRSRPRRRDARHAQWLFTQLSHGMAKC